MQVVLVMFRADGERRSFSVSRDMTIIGRREDCDLRIPLGDVSRKHCRLMKDGQFLRVEDLGSSNGTFHNGRRVQEAILRPGDHLSVGPVGFVVQIDGVPTDEEIQPASPQRVETPPPVHHSEARDPTAASEVVDLAPPPMPKPPQPAPPPPPAAQGEAEFEFSLDESQQEESFEVDLGGSQHGQAGQS